jgi:hypothetical protein
VADDDRHTDARTLALRASAGVGVHHCGGGGGGAFNSGGGHNDDALVRDGAGRMLETRMLNLGRGTGGRHLEVKAAGLHQLLRRDKFPDLVALTELWGRAGQKNKVDQLFKHLVDEYDIFYSLRSVLLSKDAATTRADGGAGIEEAPAPTTVTGSSPSGRSGHGGGIALLVHKRMCVNVRQRPFDDVALDDHDRALLDGHLRCYRLDPDVDKLRRRASVRGARANHASLVPLQPIIVTVGYAPPEGTPWGKATREIIFTTLVNVHKELHALRQEQKVFVMALVHTNAPDGGIDLELPMLGDDRHPDELKRELARAPQSAELHGRSMSRQRRRRRHDQRRRFGSSRMHNLPLVVAWRARVTVLGDGTRRLHRAYTAAQRSNTSTRGCELSVAMAAAGMVPTAGVQSEQFVAAVSSVWLEPVPRVRFWSLGAVHSAQADRAQAGCTQVGCTRRHAPLPAAPQDAQRARLVLGAGRPRVARARVADRRQASAADAHAPHPLVDCGLY